MSSWSPWIAPESWSRSTPHWASSGVRTPAWRSCDPDAAEPGQRESRLMLVEQISRSALVDDRADGLLPSGDCESGGRDGERGAAGQSVHAVPMQGPGE